MQNNSSDVKKIDTIKVSDSAATIRADAKMLRGNLDTIENIVKGTSAYCYCDENVEGPGEAFRKKFEEFKKNFDNFEEQINAYATYLDEVVAEVKDKDAKNAATLNINLP